ncbi:MAG: hypothetical protein M0Z84_04235 [Gammaproteobacteria bacterium]|nr:hypothetical protein [Gammaproteobacteria bacterium]
MTAPRPVQRRVSGRQQRCKTPDEMGEVGRLLQAAIAGIRVPADLAAVGTGNCRFGRAGTRVAAGLRDWAPA